jgi:hypothetical protein
MPSRTPEEIRQSIEDNRADLAVSVNHLRTEIESLTDWRRHIAEHRKQLLVGAAVVGFVIGGGVAAMGALSRRRRD